MSDRAAPPARDAIPDWRKTTDERLTILEQRRQGSPNGLIAPGGSGGTWAPLALVNGWVSVILPSYTLDADGFVHLRGLVQHPTSWPTGTIVTLPAGYAPKAQDEYFNAATWNGSVIGTSAIAGIVGVGGFTLAAAPTIAYGAGGWISLSGISYYVGAQ